MADDGISYTTCAASAAKAFQRNRGAHSGGRGHKGVPPPAALNALIE